MRVLKLDGMIGMIFIFWRESFWIYQELESFLNIVLLLDTSALTRIRQLCKFRCGRSELLNILLAVTHSRFRDRAAYRNVHTNRKKNTNSYLILYSNTDSIRDTTNINRKKEIQIRQTKTTHFLQVF